MQLDAGSRSRWKSTIGVVATAALTLAACGTDAGAGGGPGQAIQERLDRGVAMELTIEADPDLLEDPARATQLRDLLDRQADGPLATLSRSGDGVARGVVVGAGALEARLIEDTGYLRLDTSELGDVGLDDLDPLTGLDDLGASGGEGGDVLGALVDQGWIGVRGLTPERLAELAEDDELGEGADVPTEDLDELLADEGLDDIASLFEGYTTVAGDGPWEVTVDARALASALGDVMTLAEVRSGDDEETTATGPSDADLEDLPDEVGGITVEAEAGVASRVLVDLATVRADLESAMSAPDDTGSDDPGHDGGHDLLDDLAAADGVLVVTMVDVGDRVDVPADATVVDVDLLDALVGAGGLESLGEQD